MSLISKENFNLALQSIKKLFDKKINDSIADWNQNDSSADNYVKNRTHWEEPKLNILVNNLTYEEYQNNQAPNCTFIIGQKYDVIWNGVLYNNLICWFNDDYRILGNPEILPFYIDDDGGNSLWIESHEDAVDWTISISTIENIVHKIDKKYLPIAAPDWNQNDPNGAGYIKNRPFYISDESHIGALTFTATNSNTMEYSYSGVDSDIFQCLQLLNGKGEVCRFEVNGHTGWMRVSFDRGWFSFYGDLSGGLRWYTEEILAATINIDGISLISGETYQVDFYDTTTSGYVPISMEYLPKSIYTQDNAPVRHGSGRDSTVQGTNTTASGDSSHAEGSNSVASGAESHAEGCMTVASGEYSHAEGFDTIASSNYQHVQGKYNIEDTEQKYVHIVGNGNYATRSNAHTLDWKGNAWFAGDVYVGSTSGTNRDEGSERLARISEIDNSKSDWNETDLTNKSAILNKPFGTTQDIFTFTGVGNECGSITFDIVDENVFNAITARNNFIGYKDNYYKITFANIGTGYYWTIYGEGFSMNGRGDTDWTLNIEGETFTQNQTYEFSVAVPTEKKLDKKYLPMDDIRDSINDSYILSIYPSTEQTDVFIFEVNDNGVKQTYPMRLQQSIRKEESGTSVAINQVINQYRFEFTDDSVTTTVLEDIMDKFINANCSKFILSYLDVCVTSSLSYSQDGNYPGLYVNSGHVLIRMHLPLPSNEPV